MLTDFDYRLIQEFLNENYLAFQCFISDKGVDETEAEDIIDSLPINDTPPPQKIDGADADQEWPCNCEHFSKDYCGVHGPGRVRRSS